MSEVLLSSSPAPPHHSHACVHTLAHTCTIWSHNHVTGTTPHNLYPHFLWLRTGGASWWRRVQNWPTASTTGQC